MKLAEADIQAKKDVEKQVDDARRTGFLLGVVVTIVGYWATVLTNLP